MDVVILSTSAYTRFKAVSRIDRSSILVCILTCL
jgi:hypothetical protein